jgi:hypothetical protein
MSIFGTAVLCPFVSQYGRLRIDRGSPGVADSDTATGFVLKFCFDRAMLWQKRGIRIYFT